MKQTGRWAGGQTFPHPRGVRYTPKVQRDAVERGVDPPKIERSTMTTYDLKQTGQLIEAMRGTQLFALAALGGDAARVAAGRSGRKNHRQVNGSQARWKFC